MKKETDPPPELLQWASDEAKRRWYATARAYWDAVSADDHGVLGGYASVHAADAADSLAFARAVLGTEQRDRALDVCAGVGRVTESVLLSLARSVDLFDASDQLIDAARLRLAWAGERVRQFICVAMEDFRPAPATYDIVWIQWCVGYLSDDDLVAFLRRCRASLAPNGVIVVKDNVADADTLSDQEELHAGTFLVDDEDGSVIRLRPHLERLFDVSGLERVATRPAAELHCDELHPVATYVLR